MRCPILLRRILDRNVSTAATLLSLKPLACGRNALCAVGREYLAAAQRSKGVLRFWSWDKGAWVHDSFAPEPMHALIATLDGVYIVGGAKSGSLYVWEATTGRLLRSWPAHYKAVTSLSLVTSGSMLISGSEDATINVWILADVLDGCWEEGAAWTKPMPFHSWSEHTLPVTDLCVGLGESNAIVASSSLDCSCKIWSLGCGSLLHTARLPCAALCVLLDQGEHSLFAGGKDGRIFEVSLVGQREGMGDRDWSAMTGHSRGVTCLGISGDGARLLSGSEDGTVRFWDLATHQCVKVLSSPGKAPVSCLLVAHDPPMSDLGAKSRVAGREGAQPLARLSKFAGPVGGSGPRMLVDGSAQYTAIARRNGLMAPAACSGGEGDDSRLAALAEASRAETGAVRELTDARQAVQRLWQSHSRLLDFCTAKVLEEGWREGGGGRG
ncbi:unnamed protein product, partial [Ostreobium quekettii]